jgi:hypothetical protein
MGAAPSIWLLYGSISRQVGARARALRGLHEQW